MDSFGFIIFILIAVFFQFRKFVKKHGQGSTQEVVSDFISTIKQANELKKQGNAGKPQTEILLKQFAKRRFPKVAAKYDLGNKGTNIKDVLVKDWQSKEPTQSKMAGATQQQVFGHQGLKPDSGVARIVLIVIAITVFVGVGMGVVGFFGYVPF